MLFLHLRAVSMGKLCNETLTQSAKTSNLSGALRCDTSANLFFSDVILSDNSAASTAAGDSQNFFLFR